MSGPGAAVVVFPGSNGDRDLLEAFLAAGFDAYFHPSAEPLPAGTDVAGLPGGFSFGDYWRAGMLASQEPAVRSLRSVIDDGGLVIGVCNGFQILVEAGLLPGALSYNDPAGFRHRWLTVRCVRSAAGPWFGRVEVGDTLRLPIAHGEGAYFHPDGFAAVADRVPLVYEHNPNGSMGAVAALLDASGQVLGVMPHPERASDPLLGSSDGLRLFEGAHDWLASRLEPPTPEATAAGVSP